MPLLSLLLLLAVPLARAEIRPMFALEACAWHATHVVVVTEGEAIDGKVLVLESWKGDLHEGAELSIDELAELAPEARRTIERHWLQEEDPAAPKVVSNGRMVLFLVRDGESWAWPERLGGLMETSMVWIEGAQAYARAYAMEHEGRVRHDLSERELQAKVAEVIAAQNALRDALENGAEALAAAMPQLFGGGSVYVRSLIVDELAKHGPEVVPALRVILCDDSLLHHHAEAVRALAKAGGASVDADLVALLEEETAFWRDADRRELALWRLQGELPNEVVNRFRGHHGRVLMTLVSLQNPRGAEYAAEAVAAFRKVWGTIVAGQRDQLMEACYLLIGAE